MDSEGGNAGVVHGVTENRDNSYPHETSCCRRAALQ